MHSFLRKTFFFQRLFGCPTANFGPLSRGQPHSPNLNHCVLHSRPEGHQEPRNEVESLSLVEHLLGFEPGTLRFLLQHLNPLGHSPHDKMHRISEKAFKTINWLPVDQSVQQSLNVTVFKCVNNACPYYVKEVICFTRKNKFEK